MRENYVKHMKVERMHVVALVGVVIIINLVVLVVVRGKMKRQMQDQVSTQVQGAVS